MNEIRFYIRNPSGTVEARLVNDVEISKRGAGHLNVYAADLSSGMYTYSLVADGRIVSTKRMVKE